MKKTFLVTIFLIFTSFFSFAEVAVNNLKCEMMVNPILIDTEQPRLSWVLKSTSRNTVQEAYHIIASSSLDKLNNNVGDIWDSGKIYSSSSIFNNYEGNDLKSKQKVYWKVKIWTNKGETDWSSPANWTMGLLYYNDWEGRWIGFDRVFPWDNDSFYSRLSARYFRKEFEANKSIKNAKVYIIGLGLYELYFNGAKIGDQVLAPTPTDYVKNVKYNAFDVTNEMQSGKNAIGVILGNGRYYTMRQHYKPYKIKNYGFPKLLLQLEIEYTDGSMEIIKTDDSWKGTADGPIRTNNEYDGEEYDARKEMPGWNNIGFDESKWINAEYVQEPRGNFEAQVNPNMKIMESINPISINEISPDKYVIDMGQNMVGWLKINVKGNEGDQIKMRFAEIINKNGGIATENLRDAKASATYTLKGNETETWEPRFVYYGFRYVEIIGFPGEPKIENFTGQVVYDEIETTGIFSTSKPIINKIHENAYWGIRGNYKGMPLDCPQRNERQPWLGDRTIVSYGESFIFDNRSLYAKWVDDIGHSQKNDGTISDVAPNHWRYYSDNMTWPGTYLFIADMLYNQFGDERPIEQHYAKMKKWLEYMKDLYMTDNYIVTKDSYGDWCVPPVSIEAGRDKSANKKHPSMLISTAYYYYLSNLMMKFADITENTSDIKYYSDLAAKIKKSFINEFYNANSFSFGDNLTNNLLALHFDLTPFEDRQKVFNKIENIIVNNNNGHLSTGAVGTQWLMRTLSNNENSKLAYQLASNTTYPSWGYMIENDATTIWELWNGNTAAPDMNSYNHVMLLGDLIIWFYENQT
jgi:alpha-L-rhamnosidase